MTQVFTRITQNKKNLSKTSLESKGDFWPILVFLLFGIVYACSLSFVSVEGDDASSIAYHVLGRDRNLQPPYSSYHGLMDMVLSILPAQEPVLRIAAISLTSLAAPCMVILILALAFDWIGNGTKVQKWLVVLVIMLASPEFFYLGPVYYPSVVATCLVLAAHLLLRKVARDSGLRNMTNSKDKVRTLLSLVLFGLGAASRWDIVVYGGIIVADLVVGTGSYQKNAKPTMLNRVVFGVIWGALALSSWFIAIVMTGYHLQDVFEIFSFAESWLPSVSVLTIARIQTLYTPAFAILSVIGFAILIHRRHALVFIAVIGIALVSPWIPLGVPKLLLPAVPGIVVCVITGFTALWHVWHDVKYEKLVVGVRFVIGAILIGPWILGTRATYGDTAWGPGFEIRPFDRTAAGGGDFTITFGAGAAVPTPEGPRPLFGHAMVLLGGKWKSFVVQQEVEIREAIKYAVATNLPFLLPQGSGGFIVTKVAAMAFTTNDPRNKSLYINERRFLGKDSDHFTLLQTNNPSSIYIEKDSKRLISLAGSKVVVAGTYPSVLRSLYTLAPAAMKKLGANSALVDLDRLILTIGRSKAVELD